MENKFRLKFLLLFQRFEFILFVSVCVHTRVRVPTEARRGNWNIVICGCDRDAGIQALLFMIEQAYFTSKPSLQPHSTLKN